MQKLANFVATPPANDEKFDSGRIMVLLGLNKTELNGVHVEVVKKTQNGDSENIRWTCIIVDETVVQCAPSCEHKGIKSWHCASAFGRNITNGCETLYGRSASISLPWFGKAKNKLVNHKSK